MTLSPGTYLISVREHCTVSGKTWTLSGITQKIGKILIRAIRVEDILSLDIHGLIPERDALKELSKLKLTQLRPVKHVHLVPIKQEQNGADSDSIDWSEHSHNVSWGLLVVLVPLTIAIVLIIVCLIRQRERFPGIRLSRPGRLDQMTAQQGERQRNQDIEMDNRIDPFAYFRNLNVRVEETEQRDIQPMEVDQSSNEG